MSNRTIYINERDETIVGRAAELASKRRMSLSAVVVNLLERWVTDQDSRDPELRKGDAEDGNHEEN